MQERILEYINQKQMIQAGEHIVVGVSGGADSVCLLHVLRQLQEQGSFTIAALHVNHCLRGTNADVDERFVKLLCHQYKIPYKSVAIDVNKEAQKRGMSIEETGRMVRREAFEELARERGANKIALGHHQDDQAETVLFNLVRGSGITGLCGIHPVRGQYIRPLLCVSKTEIEDYLKRHGLAWQIDETNLMEDYTRNKIRHNVIKNLGEINSKAQEHIAASATHLQEVEEYLAPQVEEAYRRFTEAIDEGVFIGNKVQAENLFIQKRIMREAVHHVVGSLRDLSQDNIENMTTIFAKEVGKMIEIGKGFALRRTYGGAILELAKPSDSKTKEEVLVSIPGEIKWNEDKFTCQIIEAQGKPIVELTYTKCFDYDKIKGELVLRNRRSGDVIVTCQSGGKKKLKDYFINAKIPRQQRDEMLLLAAGEEVLWIVGDRISEKYKVTTNTKQILRICKEGEGLA